MKKSLVVLALLVISAGALLTSRWLGNGQQEEIFSQNWTAMGTLVGVSIVTERHTKAEKLFLQTQGETQRLERILSSHAEDSELSRLNRLAPGESLTLSRELWDAVSAGVAWHEKTGGVFDITAGPLIALWKEAGAAGQLPTPEALREARDKTGVSKLVFGKNDRTIQKSSPILIDLGGLGKGFVADQLTESLRRAGITSALVGMSGDIHALGHRPDGLPWRVGVQDPRTPDDLSALVTVVYLSDMAVSTSGNYRRFVEIGGKQYSHIVDPRTGRTAEAVPSVTVIGPDTLTTDILGTALSVLGVTEGMKLVESLPGIEALFITVDETENLVLTRSSGFARYEDAK